MHFVVEKASSCTTIMHCIGVENPIQYVGGDKQQVDKAQFEIQNSFLNSYSLDHVEIQCTLLLTKHHHAQ
jgi:hypothetical protein